MSAGKLEEGAEGERTHPVRGVVLTIDRENGRGCFIWDDDKEQYPFTRSDCGDEVFDELAENGLVMFDIAEGDAERKPRNIWIASFDTAVSALVPRTKDALSAITNIEGMPRMNGTVKITKITEEKRKGFGFITPADGRKDIFFHSLTCAGGFDSFKALSENEGASVSFVVQDSPKGPMAIDVRSVSAV